MPQDTTRQPSVAYLSHLRNYFQRIGDLWEGPDGGATSGTDLCIRMVNNLQDLMKQPMALGLRHVPTVPEFWLTRAVEELKIEVYEDEGLVIDTHQVGSAMHAIYRTPWVNATHEKKNSVAIVQLDDKGQLEGIRYIRDLMEFMATPDAPVFQTDPPKSQYILFKTAGTGILRLCPPTAKFYADPDDFTTRVLPR